MIQPNFTLFMWIIFLFTIINSIASIGLGLLGADKSTRYGSTDIISGLIVIVLIIWVSVS